MVDTTTIEKLETVTTTALTPNQRLTLYFLLGTGAVLALYDFYVARDGNTDDTESWVITSLSSKYPAVPFGFGFLMGHFFASQRGIS